MELLEEFQPGLPEEIFLFWQKKEQKELQEEYWKKIQERPLQYLFEDSQNKRYLKESQKEFLKKSPDEPQLQGTYQKKFQGQSLEELEESQKNVLKESHHKFLNKRNSQEKWKYGSTALFQARFQDIENYL